MVMAYLINEQSFKVATDKKLIKAGEYQKILDASLIVREALTQAQRIIADAKEQVSTELKRAAEAGRIAGQQEYAAALVKLGANSSTLLYELEAEITDVVTQTIRLVLDDAPAEQFYASTLRRVSRTLRDRKFISLTVSEIDLAAAKEAVEAVCLELGLPTFIEVKGDPHRPKKTCLVSTDKGSVDAGLESQMVAIKSAIAEAAKSMLQLTDDKQDGNA
jgi:type III secretion protein L